MFEKLSSLFKGKPYDAQKDIAQSGDIHERLKLAKSKKTNPEILYYLADNDADPAVRRAVIANMATPIQAASSLVRDPEVDIRMALADRLLNLWPEIEDDAQSQAYAYAVQALGVLALDEVIQIRQRLSEALQNYSKAPRGVIVTLAKDIERQVSEPILRYCISLPDEDLADILSDHPEGWVRDAIAGRAHLSADISDMIIEHEDIDAGHILIENESADIRDATLRKIVDKAQHIPEWQKPIAKRKELPAHLAIDLAKYVQHTVRETLIRRTDFDAQTIKNITSAFDLRLENEFVEDIEFVDRAPQENDSDKPEIEQKPSSQRAYARTLDKTPGTYEGDNIDEMLNDAILRGDKVDIVGILAAKTGVAFDEMEKIVGHNSPKSIVAVCWKGGFSMRSALSLQQNVMQVQAQNIIYPRGGTEYPMSQKDIQWQLELLGID